jgi:CheY-like chemotaxis protein
MKTAETILLVEDNPDDEELTRMALRNSNIANTVIAAHDGAEALEYLFCTGEYADRDRDDRPALILLDINLPKINGLEVLKRIREDPHTQLIPVVVLTTSREEQDLVASYRIGANSYLCKPVDFDNFAAAVHQLGMYWLLLNQPAI